MKTILPFLVYVVKSNLWELNPMGTAWEGLNYGCWCNVGPDYDFSNFQQGSGETVDRMDKICKNHHDDYDQALKNSAKQGAFCKPDDKQYNAGDANLILQGSWADARRNCVKNNQGDTVKIYKKKLSLDCLRVAWTYFCPKMQHFV